MSHCLAVNSIPVVVKFSLDIISSHPFDRHLVYDRALRKDWEPMYSTMTTGNPKKGNAGAKIRIFTHNLRNVIEERTLLHTMFFSKLPNNFIQT
jgi:hypothetical protein